MTATYLRAGITALVFDFDGTLAVPTLDFKHMKSRAVETLRRHAPIPARPELPTMELLALVCSELPDEDAERARSDVLATVRDVEVEAAAQSALFPFVRPLFAACAERGVATGIITRNCPEAVRMVFPDVYELCSCVLTRDDVPLVKPDPDHLVRALVRLGKKPGETLMIGDHPMDIEVGKRAGTLTAGVGSGEADMERLESHGPDYLAEDAGRLMRLLGIL